MHWLIAHVMTDPRDFLSHPFIYLFCQGTSLSDVISKSSLQRLVILVAQQSLHFHLRNVWHFGITCTFPDWQPSVPMRVPLLPSSPARLTQHGPIPQRDATLRVGLSPLCAPAAACSSRRSDTQAGPCTASVSCRRVQTETSRTGRGLGWTWCFLARRTSRFQRPTGTAAHMGVRCSPKTPSGKQPLSRLGCTLQVGLPSSLL